MPAISPKKIHFPVSCVSFCLSGTFRETGKIPHCFLPWFKPRPSKCSIYLHRFDIALSILAQTIGSIIMAKHPHLKPPSPTNVDARPTEDWMTKDRPIKCVCLGTNQWSHWLRGLLFWEWTGIMHASLFHFHSCHHNQAPYWTTTQVSTARCWRPSTRHYVSSRTRSTSRLLGLTQNWISHQPSSVISSYRTSRTPWCFTTKQTSMASIKYPSHIRGTGMIWPGFLSSSHYY